MRGGGCDPDRHFASSSSSSTVEQARWCHGTQPVLTERSVAVQHSSDSHGAVAPILEAFEMSTVQWHDLLHILCKGQRGSTDDVCCGRTALTSCCYLLGMFCLLFDKLATSFFNVVLLTRSWIRVVDAQMTGLGWGDGRSEAGWCKISSRPV